MSREAQCALATVDQAPLMWAMGGWALLVWPKASGKSNHDAASLVPSTGGKGKSQQLFQTAEGGMACHQ